MTSETRTPKWLKRIQEGSWEPEILISGIVLFGLFKTYPLIDDLNYFLNNNGSFIFSGGTVDRSIATILKFANIILIIGFVTHILFRSVWAAFIGLSFVYKKGIDFSNLKYPDKYIKHIQSGSNYEKQIIRLEKVCSTLFAVSFLIFMWLIGLVFFLIIVAIFFQLMLLIFSQDILAHLFIDDILTFLTLLMIIDLISLGWFKRIPYVNAVFYPIYRLGGWLTLSFLYRNIYYGLISNNSRWKIRLILFVFSGLAIFSFVASISPNYQFGRVLALTQTMDSENRITENHYRSKVLDGYYSEYMHIDDYVCSESTVELFVVHRSVHEERYIFKGCDYEAVKNEPGINKDSLSFHCLNKFYGIAIDGNKVENDFVYLRNSLTGQDGLLQVIEISGLSKGKHTINLYYNFFVAEEDSTYRRNVENLQFYKSGL